jgi:hypothetical protein
VMSWRCMPEAKRGEGLLLLLAVSAREARNLSFHRNRLACAPSQVLKAVTAGQVDRLDRGMDGLVSPSRVVVFLYNFVCRIRMQVCHGTYKLRLQHRSAQYPSQKKVAEFLSDLACGE